MTPPHPETSANCRGRANVPHYCPNCDQSIDLDVIEATHATRLQQMREALEELKPFIRELRVDASGEDGRMPCDRMYLLADKLAALAASPEEE